MYPHTHTLTHTQFIIRRWEPLHDGGVSELKKDSVTERLARAGSPARADKCFTNGAN